jgi:type IV pilus assembly protein PilM
MAKSGGPTVGLDIGSHSIKVAEVAPGRSGPVVRAMGSAPTPAGAMENNVVVDPQLLGQAVKNLLKTAGVSARASVSSVSGQSALVVRVIEVPRMSDSELAETMKWEVERHVPFAANEVIMDFQPIERPDTPPDSQNMEVLLAVAQQDMIDRHVDMLMAAGLKPAAVDVEPLAAARSLIELGPDPYGQKTVAIVNIGATNTDIGIFRDGILSFPRTLPLAGDSLTRAIAQQMGVPDEQAEELKLKYGEVILDDVTAPVAAPSADEGFLDFSAVPDDNPIPAPMPFDYSEEDPAVQAKAGETAAPEAAAPDFDLGDTPAAPAGSAPDFDLGETTAPAAAATSMVPASQHDPNKISVFAAIAPVLSELLTELRRSLEYYRGRSSDGRIDEILLAGGTARLRGLDQFLSAELGIPTRVANPTQYTTVTAKSFAPDHFQEIAPSFAVAIGLGARDMVSAPVPAGAGGKKKK